MENLPIDEPSVSREYFLELARRLTVLMNSRGLEAGAAAVEPEMAAEILALAWIVAHTSERKFAPIATYAAGIAVGRLKAAGLLPSPEDETAFIEQVRKGLEPA